MPSRITPEKAQDRLADLFPDWVEVLAEDYEGWPYKWMEVSGCSQRVAFEMRDRAVELTLKRSNAILHLYRLGQLSYEAADELLRPFLRSNLQEQKVPLILPPTYEEERKQSKGKVVPLFDHVGWDR